MLIFGAEKPVAAASTCSTFNFIPNIFEFVIVKFRNAAFTEFLFCTSVAIFVRLASGIELVDRNWPSWTCRKRSVGNHVLAFTAVLAVSFKSKTWIVKSHQRLEL